MYSILICFLLSFIYCKWIVYEVSGINAFFSGCSHLKERKVEINREKRYMDDFISFLKLLTHEVNGFVFLICQLIVFIVWM